MKIIIIAAMARNRVIGKRGAIPWHIPGELQRFKRITMGHVVVMGRKTYESIGKPLPGRTNIVITRQNEYPATGCLLAGNLQEALSLCKQDAKIFICGGGEIYREAMEVADEISLTVLDRDVDGDTVFPEINSSIYAKIREERVSGPESYTLLVFARQEKRRETVRDVH
jgi:dihydrofolate reductase